MTGKPDERYDVLVYGEGGGVMFDFATQGPSAQAVADEEVQRWTGYPQAARVSVWAADRKSGYASRRLGGVAG